MNTAELVAKINAEIDAANAAIARDDWDEYYKRIAESHRLQSLVPRRC
jgi:hypothetical protein